MIPGLKIVARSESVVNYGKRSAYASPRRSKSSEDPEKLI